MDLPALIIEDFGKAAPQQREDRNERSWLESMKTRLGASNSVEQCRDIHSEQQNDWSQSVAQAVTSGLYKKAGLGLLSEMLAA